MKKTFRLVAAALATAACATVGVAACSTEAVGPGAGTGGDSGASADGHVTTDAPLACPPASLDEWHAGAYHHAEAVQPSACDGPLLNDYFASCLGPDASPETCNQGWGAGEDPAHATCQNCLVTAASSSVWGPLVDYGTGADGGAGGTVSVNVAGCVEILDPSQLTCVMSVQQADECQHAACDPVCPVSDSTSFASWQSCIGAAAAGECTGYLQSASCVNGEDAGPAATCVTGQTFQDEFFAIAHVFCGGGAPD